MSLHVPADASLTTSTSQTCEARVVARHCERNLLLYLLWVVRHGLLWHLLICVRRQALHLSVLFLLLCLHSSLILVVGFLPSSSVTIFTCKRVPFSTSPDASGNSSCDFLFPCDKPRASSRTSIIDGLLTYSSKLSSCCGDGLTLEQGQLDDGRTSRRSSRDDSDRNANKTRYTCGTVGYMPHLLRVYQVHAIKAIMSVHEHVICSSTYILYDWPNKYSTIESRV